MEPKALAHEPSSRFVLESPTFFRKAELPSEMCCPEKQKIAARVGAGTGVLRILLSWAAGADICLVSLTRCRAPAERLWTGELVLWPDSPGVFNNSMSVAAACGHLDAPQVQVPNMEYGGRANCACLILN